MKRIPILVVALLLAAANLRATGLEADFESGNKLYVEGKYAEAVGVYDKLLESGRASAALYYNRGNAYFKLNQLGRAIDSYRHAQMLAPRDPDLRANLELARTRARGGVPFHPDRLHSWLGRVSLNEWTLLTAAALWLFFLLLALTQWRRELASRVRTFVYATAAAVLLFGICLGIQLEADVWTRTAIVTAGEAEVRNGPLDESPAVYKVRDGIELTVLDRMGNWLQVMDSAQRTGWLREDQVIVFEVGGSRNGKS